MSKTKWDEFLPRFVANPNWIQGWFVSGFFTTAWFCFAVLIPDHHFKPVAVVLVFFQTMVTYIMRAGKYVISRSTEVPDVVVGIPMIPAGSTTTTTTTPGSTVTTTTTPPATPDDEKPV